MNIRPCLLLQENFIRQGIKEFPHQESQLFKTLVANFHHCQTYGEGATAAEYLNQAFNGQRGFKDFENCDTCGNERAEKKCSKCKIRLHVLNCSMSRRQLLEKHYYFEFQAKRCSIATRRAKSSIGLPTRRSATPSRKK